MLDTSENLVIIRMPSWELSSSGCWAPHKVQFPIGQWVIILDLRASMGAGCGREEGENLIRTETNLGVGKLWPSPAFPASTSWPWVFLVLLEPPACSSLSPGWKSNWGGAGPCSSWGQQRKGLGALLAVQSGAWHFQSEATGNTWCWA